MLLPGTALAHPEPGAAGGRELFAGEGVLSGDKQHQGEDGHLPAVQTGDIEVVGKAGVTNPSGAGNTGRIADVTGYGDYAYLEPTCEAGGVHVMDIADPAAPVEVPEAFIPTSPGSYAGEGIQVVPMANEFFTGDLLVHQNETCDPALVTDPALAGGISLWNVTDPRSPQPIRLHTGDTTNPEGGVDPSPNTVHSMRVWTDEMTGRTYSVLVDNEESTDIDILDITDPANPVLVNDTLDLIALFGVDQDSPDNLTQIFSHDMDVYRIGQRYVMNMAYWDGGYVLLDVTDPAAVTLIAETDFAELDEQRLERGEEISPEGNAHQSELSPDRNFMLATDEDFNPYRAAAVIDDGPYAGTEYAAVSAPDTPTITAENPVTGPVTHVGLGCEAVPAGAGTALVERGVCPFQQKLDTITAAGYTAGIVFNSVVEGCDELISMAAAGEIPFAFVGRTTGLQLLGLPAVSPETACATPSPAAGGTGASTTISAVFDGWGYVRLFGTDIPHNTDKGGPNGSGGAGSIEQIDTYAVPESQDPAFAEGFGDLSVHEVAMDPDEQGIAYLSYYSAGLRVVRYDKDGITEIGSFIDEGGSNLWGVEVWSDENGEKFVLASDRDFGLYVFRVGTGG